MELYRAMCDAEFHQTLRSRQPVFLRRFKWFSPSREFVEKRVMDGQFNNSRFKPDHYTKLIRFTISAENARLFRQGQKEWALDRRLSNLISWVSVDPA